VVVDVEAIIMSAIGPPHNEVDRPGVLRYALGAMMNITQNCVADRDDNGACEGAHSYSMC
jgi:hypothetical protein